MHGGVHEGGKYLCMRIELSHRADCMSASQYLGGCKTLQKLSQLDVASKKSFAADCQVSWQH